MISVIGIFLSIFINYIIIDHILPQDQHLSDYNITLGIDTSRLPKT